MARARRKGSPSGGIVGLGASLSDEGKRFADARWPYPLERHSRGALDALISGDDRGPRLEHHAKGFVWAILDDGMDQAEQEEQAEIAALRDIVAELSDLVDRMGRER